MIRSNTIYNKSTISMISLSVIVAIMAIVLTSCVDVPQRNAEYRQNSFRARSEYNAFEDTTAIDATIVIVNYGGLDVESVTLTVSIVALHQYGDTSAQQAIQKENKGGTISTMDTI